MHWPTGAATFHLLVANNTGIGAVLLECTNMTPYARALSRGFACRYSASTLL
jgi:hypothetical protein